MPEMSDIFVLQADPTAYVQAMALADAAANQSKAVIKGLAQAAIEGDKEMVAALQQLTGNYAPLKGKIDEVKSAYKEWIQAQAKGSDDVAAKEDAYKARLGEVQALTTASAAAAVNARKELLAVTDSVTVAEQKAGAAADHTATIAAAGNAVVKEGMAEKIALYARLSKEEDELRAKMNATFRDAANGVPKAAEAYAVLDGQLKKVVKSKENLGQEAGIVSQKAMNMNFALGQLSYGAQDLVTVLAQPGMGLGDALRSTGNNIGVVAQVAYGPLAGALATAGIMAAAFGAKMLEGGESTAKATRAHEEHKAELLRTIPTIKEYTDHIDRMRSFTDKSRDSIEGLIEAEGALADMKLSEQLKPLNEAAQGKEGKIQQYKDTLRKMSTETIKLFPEEEQERFRKDPTSFFGSIREALNKEESELAIIDLKRTEIKKERAKQIASRNIDKQFRNVDGPLKQIADREMATFGPVDEKLITERMVRDSGIKPENEIEAELLREKISGMLRSGKEKAVESERKERMMPLDERAKKFVEIRSKEMREPLAEEERKVGEAERNYRKAERQTRSPDSDSGVKQSNAEKESLRAMKDVLEMMRNAFEDHKDAIERQIEVMKENNKYTKENTDATVDSGPAMGLRAALNPFVAGR